MNTLSSGTDIATGLNNPYGIYWRKDGGKLYVANASGDNIVEYTITQYNDGSALLFLVILNQLEMVDFMELKNFMGMLSLKII